VDTVWSTLSINVVGSAVLGGMAAQTSTTSLGSNLKLLVGTGFCGAFTTFSTFSVDTIALLHAAKYSKAAAYVLLSNGVSIGAAATAYRLLKPVMGP